MRPLTTVVLSAIALVVALVPARAGHLAGPEVNVSRLPGLQSGAAIAIDPSNDQILLAGSNSIEEGTMRIYSSTDGGATWQTATTHPPPARKLASCASDPGVAIDARGRQYYSFVRAAPCREGGMQHVYVVTRGGPGDVWSKPVRVSPARGALFDDKPAIAVNNSRVSRFRGRVYVAWTRVARNAVFSIVLSSSDDGGRTWSRPVKVNETGRELTYASVAAARNGAVFVAWDDVGEFALRVARSTDGGAHFGRERKVASFVAVTIPHCGSGIVIPAQPRTCVNANPIVAVDSSGGRYSGRVYVTYARTEFRGTQAAHVAVFNSRLRPLMPDQETGEGRPVATAPGRQRSDQFWSQSAVDPVTGTPWICFYDTLGDPERKRAFYSCTVSRNGGRTWLKPIRAATVASDETQPEAAGHYGYYQGLAVANGVAHPIWTDSRDLGDLAEEIYTTRLAEADLAAPASR